MSRGEIAAKVAETGHDWPRDPDGAPLYPGPERDWPLARRRSEIASGKPYALRLDTRRLLRDLPPLTWSEIDPFGEGAPLLRGVDLALWGDVLLARKEMRASYHLAVVVDDAFQG